LFGKKTEFFSGDFFVVEAPDIFLRRLFDGKGEGDFLIFSIVLLLHKEGISARRESVESVEILNSDNLRFFAKNN
jgi:hypothetical protein